VDNSNSTQANTIAKPQKFDTRFYGDLIVANLKKLGHHVEQNVMHPNGRSAIVDHTDKMIIQVRRYSSFSRKVGIGQSVEYPQALEGYGIRIHYIVSSSKEQDDLRSRKADLELEPKVFISWEWEITKRPIILKLGNNTFQSSQEVESWLLFILRIWNFARMQDKNALMELLNYPHSRNPEEARYSGIKCCEFHRYVVTSTGTEIELTQKFCAEAVNLYVCHYRADAIASVQLGLAVSNYAIQ